jgi:hypothetical protein
MVTLVAQQCVLLLQAYYRLPKTDNNTQMITDFLNKRMQDKAKIKIEVNPQTAEILSLQ